jgi:hypothetical protein
MAGNKTPTKRILCVNSRGNKVYHYNAMAVLAALAANHMIGIEIHDNQLRIVWIKEKQQNGSEYPAESLSLPPRSPCLL